MAESMADYQKAFLLLQLLGAENGRLAKGEANKALTKGGNQRLGMVKAGDANSLRDSLCPQYIKKSRGRSEKGGHIDVYELTEEGQALLLQLPMYPLEIQIPGRAIGRLLELVRRTQPIDGQNGATDADLKEEIVRTFEELRRERYSHTRLVPIWDVRRSIRSRLGEDAARHSVLDKEILSLWRDGRLRLVPINDGRGATPEEMQDAIPGEHQTWFYLEASR
jgi:hypothetical protein